jgi:heme/copper-type cytochrome/quinol oxidase subunit 3
VGLAARRGTRVNARSEQVEGLPLELEGRRSTGWWGMVLFIITELALFGSALASYFYLRTTAPLWPPAGIEQPDIAYGLALTVILLSSSLPIWLGERAIRRGRRGQMQAWFGLALLLALVFLGMQAHEYATSSFGHTDGAYGALWYTITGLHGFHLIGAVLIMGAITVRAFFGHFDRDHHLAVSVGALYWHFVDVVWIAIFLSLYLSPHL